MPVSAFFLLYLSQLDNGSDCGGIELFTALTMDEEATATDSSITKLSLTELLASNYLRRLTFLFDHESFTAIQQHHSIVLDTERKSLNGAKLSLLVAKAIHSIDFNNTKMATTVTDTSEDQAIDTINNGNNKNQFLNINNFQIKFKLPKVQADDDDDINKVGKLILLNAEYNPPLSRATANSTNPSLTEEVSIANEVVVANLENKLSYIDIIQNIGHIIHTIFSSNKVSDNENNVGYIDGSDGGDSLVVVENSNNINVDEGGEGDKDLLSRNAKMRRSQTNTIFSALGKYDA